MRKSKASILGMILMIQFILLFTASCVKVDPDSIIPQNVNLQAVKDGKYKATYQHFPVKVKVEVIVKGNTIKNIKILKHREGQGEKAEKIIDQVLQKQSVEIDVITGATLSSKCILKAVELALQDAKD
ncbi:MAG: FMN-binding protein [Spirochaetes bacterium]|nr:FMN-binding protein [Spirochaetota bacterium]